MMFVIPGNSKYLWNAVKMSKDNVINNIKNKKKSNFRESLFDYVCANVRIVFDLRDLRFELKIYYCKLILVLDIR